MLSIVTQSCQQSSKYPVEKEQCIMAYYVPGNLDVNKLPLQQLTHIIYSFTEVRDNQMVWVNGVKDQKLKDLVVARKQFPHLKVMVACGGWGGSGGFSEMCRHDDKRATFVKSTIDFIERYQLDGIDMDWEYPGLLGAGNPYSKADKENFTALMKELRESMDQLKPGLTLSFAAAGWQKYFDHIELDKVMKHVDYMNIMTYDLAGANHPVTAHHTGLYSLQTSQLDEFAKEALNAQSPGKEWLSAHNIVDYCLAKGVNPQQIVIGAAYYGRAWKGVDPKDKGLYKAHKGFKGYYTYQQIKEMVADDEQIANWDDVAKAPYLYLPADSIFVTYDSPLSVSKKVEYLKKHKLGGIMFWQLSQDSEDFELTNSIYKSLKH